MVPVVQRETMGCDRMGSRLLVQDGAFTQVWLLGGLLGGDSAVVTQEWRSLGLESVNDNDPDRPPDRQAEMARSGASAPGGGPE